MFLVHPSASARAAAPLGLALLALATLASVLSGAGCTPASATGGPANARSVTLLNVSYDPTREFYEEVNAAFAADYRQRAGVDVTVQQSHGGSGKQARSVIDGLDADVVTLALAYDIDAIAEKTDLIPPDWREKLPHRSSPYTSTIVFLVRKGNPKGIKDWDDLVKGDVQIITPNPKTSGGARWNYLAAWGYVLQRELGDLQRLNDPASAADVAAAQAKARAFVGEVLRRVPVLDSGARGSTNTFLQRGIGDVLLTWENEALLAAAQFGADQVEIVTPSVSILAEPPVAVVEGNATRHGTLDAARAYLEFLYTPAGQSLAAKHHFRPATPEAAAPELLRQFPEVKLFTIDEAFGGWAAAQAEHFDDGGVFDQLYQPGN